jgi:mycothiol system anti-sigma-R factor
MDTNHDCGCQSARERMDILIDRELTDMECADVRAHCATCDSCQAEVALMEKLTDRFRAACAEPAPDNLRIAILNSIQNQNGNVDA